ncbi:hypothetical protein BBF96_13175 [Anoxybacter fermentans]|uniref:DUF2232 domain-containing protein n=1 Tax=Anoxybacter fermentans TaxID=1323375 RepID=A0A3S9T155_9FIRM|nr:DUF2232 domain-containing protein [Anoxybacter fermentans]AZR74269.1 hypothetical protein BBF96_13175 [Anoxybacter fermentans]
MGEEIKAKERRDIFLVGILGGIFSLGVVRIPELIIQLIFLIVIMPLPYIYLLNKYGHRSGTLAIIWTGMFNSLFFGFMGLVIALISFGLLGVTIGGAFYEKIKPSRTALISVIASGISGLLFYYLAYRYGIIQSMKGWFIESVNIWEEILRTEIPINLKRKIVDDIMTIIPGMTIIIFIFFGLITYYLSAALLRYRGFDIPKLKPIKKWMFPRWIAFLYFLFEIMPKDPVSVNVIFILTFILMSEGIAVVVYYGDKWGIYSWIRNTIIVIGIMLFSISFFILGLVDNLFQLRGFKKQEE